MPYIFITPKKADCTIFALLVGRSVSPLIFLLLYNRLEQRKQRSEFKYMQSALFTPSSCECLSKSKRWDKSIHKIRDESGLKVMFTSENGTPCFFTFLRQNYSLAFRGPWLPKQRRVVKQERRLPFLYIFY